MKYKFYTIYAYLLLTILLVPALLAYCMIRIFVKYPSQMKAVYAVNRIVISIWSRMVGIKFHVKHRERADRKENYIVVMNHVNLTDIFLVNSCLNIPGKPLIKKETLKIPILGWLFGMTAVTVDRGAKKSRNSAYFALKNALLKGDSLLIFPEGSRNNSNLPLNNFNLGAFRLSIESGIKILPVVAINSRSLGFGKSLIIKPRAAELHYLPPMDPNNFDGSAEKLKEHCFNCMKNEILAADDYFRTN
ncbi:MAG: 1-acyl-sn-glycerol-3-phosphate acyltransferase [Bacteroidetes bacterium]|nr:1-acyl-sn-glycerol-3-phosphate acyltransferase [Bacteroidota bacterium]